MKMKARKKPVEVEVERFAIEKWLNRPDKYPMVKNHPFSPMQPHRPVILTLEGAMEVSDGDWIIQGVFGEYYPCKPDIFEKTYELIEKGVDEDAEN